MPADRAPALRSCLPRPWPPPAEQCPATAPAPLSTAPTPAALPAQLTAAGAEPPSRRGGPRCRARRAERKGRRRRAVRHLPWPLGGRLGAGAAPGAGSGGAVGHGPGPARPCPRCPEVEMQKSRLSCRDVDFLVVLFFLTLLFPPQRRSERLGASAARSAGGRESVPGHRDPLGFRAGLEVSRSEEWVSGREPQEGSSAVKRGGAPVRSHLPPPRLPY